MTVLRLPNGDDLIEMSVAIEEDEKLQSNGDVYVTLKMQSEGFSGHNDLWMLADQMRKFASALVALERHLRGEAKLEYVSPNELSLKVFSVLSRGNLAIQESTGYEVVHENRSFWHSVSFGFEIEPSQLSHTVHLPWVRRYAG